MAVLPGGQSIAVDWFVLLHKLPPRQVKNSKKHVKASSNTILWHGLGLI
jgi:hypothetical protein